MIEHWTGSYHCTMLCNIMLWHIQSKSNVLMSQMYLLTRKLLQVSSFNKTTLQLILNFKEKWSVKVKLSDEKLNAPYVICLSIVTTQGSTMKNTMVKWLLSTDAFHTNFLGLQKVHFLSLEKKKGHPGDSFKRKSTVNIIFLKCPGIFNCKIKSSPSDL